MCWRSDIGRENVMMAKKIVDSPVGRLILTGTEEGLTGLWREEYCHYPPELRGETTTDGALPVLDQTADWLERYFAGERMDGNEIPLTPRGSAFRREVWDLIRAIPYGELMTYGEAARILAERRGIPKMAAQAVGGAVGHNPISILIPCHRVIGANGNLTGYGGSMWVKKWLLAHEGVDLSGFWDPAERKK